MVTGDVGKYQAPVAFGDACQSGGLGCLLAGRRS